MTDETPAPVGATLTGPTTMASALTAAAAKAEQLGIKLAQPFQPLAGQHIAPNAEARALAVANRSGQDPARIDAALTEAGVDPSLRDGRTPEQRRHDEAHGMPATVDPKAYYFSLPSAEVIGNPAAFNVDVQQTTAELGFAGDRGNQFAGSIVAAVRAAAADPDRAATQQRHEAQLRAAFGHKYEAKAASINALLDDLGIANKAFVKQLRPDGLIGSHPFLFTALANRAAALASWKAGRPK